jgi:uncharacterized membrane protein YeaQ/YmgE (transglycosylase-associated protein family)
MFVLSSFTIHLTTITITTGLIVYLVIAAIVGLIAEFLVGWRLPFGFIGAIIAALLGIWLLTNVINLTIAGDPVIYGVPIIKALIGAIILVALWHLLTTPLWRRRKRYSYRYRRRYRDRY